MKKSQKINSIDDASYGDLLFFTPSSSLFSRLIPIVDGSKFSHVAMYIGHRYGHHIFIESQDFKGVIISQLKDWRNYEIIRPNKGHAMPPSVILQDLGKPYDRRKIVELLFHKLFGTPLTVDDDQALICSEAVNKWYNYKLFEKGRATPATLYHSLTK